MYKLVFYASIVWHNGKPALMIRKIFTKSEDIEKILKEILEKGKFEFQGVLVFRNVVSAIESLKRVGLLK